MWGTRFPGHRGRRPRRFIPTHVGNTRRSSISCARATVHPHACGEHLQEHGGQPHRAGSSPRMWGTLVARRLDDGEPRFIPTHVGNTSASYVSAGISSVHPHACGEHKPSSKAAQPDDGSSPRMWGTPDCEPVRSLSPRFIPTHVGNTLTIRASERPAPVHPHACGEHRCPPSARRPGCGSSPRMWGTLLHARLHALGHRFIPTHVGNTIGRQGLVERLPVHPHACGEHFIGRDRLEILAGSSPRMWGTPVGQGTGEHVARFIPTHVGNTRKTRRPARRCPVHPHACGEHETVAEIRAGETGSSPRMWGTLDAARLEHLARRFIPTHVGNTLADAVLKLNAAVHPHACGEH